MSSLAAGVLIATTAFAAPVSQTSAAGSFRAVRVTAARASACTALGDFYWEIGDASHVLASGQVGTQYGAQASINIASASKWVFGSYVLEREHGTPTDAEIMALTMRSGYVTFNPLLCALSPTVQGCFSRRTNSQLTASAVGDFYYGGGHDEKLAIDLGLGGLTRDGLAAEINAVLGNGLNFGYATPDLAGGMSSTPANYGAFLRLILGGELHMADSLAEPSVCTLPGTCPQALHSPVPYAWHYGLNHWIEDDPSGDGAFSSPGAMGFYPWISADRTLYGLLARHSYGNDAAVGSVLCGERLRRAWVTGKAQLD